MWSAPLRPPALGVPRLAVDREGVRIAREIESLIETDVTGCTRYVIRCGRSRSSPAQAPHDVAERQADSLFCLTGRWAHRTVSLVMSKRLVEADTIRGMGSGPTSRVGVLRSLHDPPQRKRTSRPSGHRRRRRAGLVSRRSDAGGHTRRRHLAQGRGRISCETARAASPARLRRVARMVAG